MTIVKEVLDDCELLVEDLDGQMLDERQNSDSDADTPSKAEARDHKVRTSRDLQRLAHQLEMAATLVRNEYWHARGGPDFIYERNNQ